MLRFARKLGWQHERLRGILTGRIEKVRLIELVRVAEELKMPVDQLVARIARAKDADLERRQLLAEKLLAGKYNERRHDSICERAICPPFAPPD